MSNMNCNRMSCQMNSRNSRQDICLEDVALGMGYIPWHAWENVYDIHRGHQAGTIFPCLDKPFMGRSMWK